jgi:predicted PurR-regulated permease PerM
MPRSLAALLSTLVVVVAIAGGLWLVGWQVSGQLEDLRSQFGDTLDDARTWLTSLPAAEQYLPEIVLEPGAGQGTDGGDGTGGASGHSGAGQADDAPPTGTTTATDGDGGGNGGVLLTVLGGTVTFLAQLLLGLVATFFYLRDGHRIGTFLQRLFPRHRRDDAREVAEHVWDTTSEYIRGQTMVALFDGAFVAIGLLIAGIPLAFALGALVFLGAYVPVVGSIAAGSVAVLVALVSGGIGDALIALAIVVAVQQIEGNVLAPVVLGRELAIHPLAVLAAVTAGAALMGPFGAIVAVPLTASVHRAVVALEGRHHAAAT